MTRAESDWGIVWLGRRVAGASCGWGVSPQLKSDWGILPQFNRAPPLAPTATALPISHAFRDHAFAAG